MRATRTYRAAQAEIVQLRAQLEVYNHDTRKSLNDYVKATRKKNEDLTKALEAAQAEIKTLKSLSPTK